MTAPVQVHAVYFLYHGHTMRVPMCRRASGGDPDHAIVFGHFFSDEKGGLLTSDMSKVTCKNCLAMHRWKKLGVVEA